MNRKDIYEIRVEENGFQPKYLINEGVVVDRVPVISIENNKMKLCVEESGHKVMDIELISGKSKAGSERLLFQWDDGEFFVGKKEKSLAVLSYKKVMGKLVKSFFVNPFNKEYLFSMNKKSGSFSQRVDTLLENNDELKQIYLSKEQFYNELFQQIKEQLILGYLSTNVEGGSAEYYLKNANEENVKNNFGLEDFEVNTYVKMLEKESAIPENFYGGFLERFGQGVYSNEMTLSESEKLKESVVLKLMQEKESKKTLFSDIKLQKRVYKKMREEQTSTIFNMRKLSMMNIDDFVRNSR